MRLNRGFRMIWEPIALFEQRRPGWIGGKILRRDRLLVAAGEVDRIEPRSAGTGRFTEEHQHAAVRRPGRSFLREAGRQDALARSVGLHHTDLELAARLPGERYQVAARRPDGRRIYAIAKGDARLAGAVGIH